ncbi:MAG: aldehyde dehydrogenase family protein [archaeon]|nr:aldehyde dehydrogenase family protein [archaeon]
MIQEIDLAATKLDEWMAGDTSISVPLIHKPGKAFVMREPLGVVLIIAPFNYPLRLLLLPLIGAIAAGNAALLKPSEISGQTARAFNRILPKYGENTSFFQYLFQIFFSNFLVFFFFFEDTWIEIHSLLWLARFLKRLNSCGCDGTLSSTQGPRWWARS